MSTRKNREICIGIPVSRTSLLASQISRFTRQTTRSVSQVIQDTREKHPSNISSTVSVHRCNYNVSLYVNRSNSRRAIKCKAEGDRVVRAIPLVRFRCRRRTKRAPHPPATPPKPSCTVARRCRFHPGAPGTNWQDNS